MRKSARKFHPSVKKALGYKASNSESEITADWNKRLRTVCKPCWELKYCPYGPLVEDFPLPPLVRKGVAEHNAYLQSCLDSGKLADGRPLNKQQKKSLRDKIKFFNPADYPEEIPSILSDASCRVFGHICPAYFVAEPLTETRDRRKATRFIPRDVMIKVIRRDGQICQKCNEPVRDDEVEFDHIIPFSKGGTSTVGNVRLLHRICNRVKSDTLAELLSPDPIEHLFELREEVRNRRGKR